AQVALLAGQALAAPQPEPQVTARVGDAASFDPGDEFEPLERPEPQTASVFSLEAVAEVRGEPESVASPAEAVPPFAQAFPTKAPAQTSESENEPENGDQLAADARRAAFISNFLQQTRVPA